jgi:hypothetical protein
VSAPALPAADAAPAAPKPRGRHLPPSEVVVEFVSVASLTPAQRLARERGLALLAQPHVPAPRAGGA